MKAFSVCYVGFFVCSCCHSVIKESVCNEVVRLVDLKSVFCVGKKSAHFCCGQKMAVFDESQYYVFLSAAIDDVNKKLEDMSV